MRQKEIKHTTLTKTLLASLAVLVLTLIHHLYGAVIYEAPFRLHVVFYIVPVIFVQLVSYGIHRKYPSTISGKSAFWIFIVITLVVSVGLIGFFEGGYNHLVKNILFFGGAPESTLNQLFPPPAYEMPNNFWFEATGILQFVFGIYTGILLSRFKTFEKIQLRPATITDLESLEHWDKQPHVIAAAPNDHWDWKTELQQNYDWQEMLIAELDGRSAGFIQIIDPAREETHYWGDIGEGYRAIDIWIGEARDLGKGYGTEMMKLTIDRCFADSEVKAVLVDPLESNTKVHRFYERLGFRFVEKRRFGEDDCLVYRLDREEWN